MITPLDMVVPESVSNYFRLVYTPFGAVLWLVPYDAGSCSASAVILLYSLPLDINMLACASLALVSIFYWQAIGGDEVIRCRENGQVHQSAVMVCNLCC